MTIANMPALANPNEAQELRRLIPLSTLPPSHLDRLCAEIKIEDAPEGAILFHQGAATNELVYLLAGTVSLQAGGTEMDSVVGGSDAARFALAHQNPRKVSAVAKSPVRFVRINPKLVNRRDESGPGPSSYEVNESSENPDDDWMSALLRLPIFQRLPPANLQAILRTIEEIQVKAGEVIFRQNDAGDYFYIIKWGAMFPDPKAFSQRKGH